MPSYGAGFYGAGIYGLGQPQTIVWGESELSRYQNGVDRGVFYPLAGDAVPWNGLVSVQETNEAVEPEPLYFNGVKYVDLQKFDDFKASVQALSAPAELDITLGIVPIVPGFFLAGQPRRRFNFSYRSGVNESDYKIHLVYNAMATRGPKSAVTLSDNNEVEALSYELSTIPVSGPPSGMGMSALYKPAAHFVVESIKAPAERLAELEAYLYGTALEPPTFPTASQLTDIFKADWAGPTR